MYFLRMLFLKNSYQFFLMDQAFPPILKRVGNSNFVKIVFYCDLYCVPSK